MGADMLQGRQANKEEKGKGWIVSKKKSVVLRSRVNREEIFDLEFKTAYIS